MNIKSIIGVIIIAIVIGVLYVVIEKNFKGSNMLSSSGASSAQEMSKEKAQKQAAQETSIIALPSPEAAGAVIDESTDLAQEAESLEMRDYSGYFEDLKDSVAK